MAQYYDKNIEEITVIFNVSEENGLSSEEANKRIKKYGYNKLKTKKKKSFLRMFLEQFRSFMIIVLLVAAIVSGIIGVMEGEGLLDTYIILGILILNAFVGSYQEKKAESSLESLKNLSAPLTKVLRDGAVKEIPTTELVPGDIVILETGAIVPADLRLIQAVNLKIQESAMTGESVPVEKNTDTINGNDTALGDRVNMAFSSGIVTYGRGKGIVVATGMQTEVGKIAEMLQLTEDTETPMKIRLEKLGKVLGLAALIICAVIFIVGVLYGNSALNMFMTAVSLAVAAIPEGLPAVSTVVLAIGVRRLVKRKAIIRTLPSVETLGSATVICSDKTGTLTQNKMAVVEAYTNNRTTVFDNSHSDITLTEEEKKLFIIAVLCNDAHMKIFDNGNTETTGDPTETALLDIGKNFGFNKNELEKSYPRVAEIPFDSGRKRMSTVNRMPDDSTYVNVKGGLDEVLSVCGRILANGEKRPLTPDDIEYIKNGNKKMADSALRVLAMAYKHLPGTPENTRISELENELVFVGLVGMIDPARPEVAEAVEKCRTAGIRPVMITGDHKNTAMAIAREIGIFQEGDLAITGTELEQINEEEFNENVSRYAVYARVAPEHKVRIVKAWQNHEEIIAMTGDGVNDAPALKQADIGAAMGITGTDVAKGASDMVLTDDNFATIVAAVEEGRRIYDNILKAIQFLLSTNVGEIFLLLVTSVLNWGIPLLPIHILWVNLVTDSLPALALSVDPAEKNIMKRKPKNTKKGFMTRGMIWRTIYQGIMIGLIPLAAYKIGLHDGGIKLGQTMAFSVLVFAQLIHVRNLHSNTRSSLAISPLRNKPLVGAIFISAALMLLVLFIPPIREAFSLTTMDSRHWLTVILMSFIPIVVVDLFKLLKINTTKDEL
ncbi:MAG: calcium-translocating P-type ATPase, SERCA-type [Ignavibacteria bacterium]|nr:calcium-translocating P-type ATPase, SERCA-type [Ignavibacteria bacterium]